MATTIQISEDLKKELKDRKMYKNESYEQIIWDLIDDTRELSEETQREIELSRKEISEGKFVTLAEAKKQLGL